MTDEDLVKWLREVAENMYVVGMGDCKLAANLIEKQKEYIDYYKDQTNVLLKKVDRLEGNIRTGIYMRQRQKQYLKDKTQKNLIEAKQAEAAFDRVAEKYK